jgi:hypothetical protein
MYKSTSVPMNLQTDNSPGKGYRRKTFSGPVEDTLFMAGLFVKLVVLEALEAEAARI